MALALGAAIGGLFLYFSFTDEKQESSDKEKQGSALRDVANMQQEIGPIDKSHDTLNDAVANAATQTDEIIAAYTEKYGADFYGTFEVSGVEFTTEIEGELINNGSPVILEASIDDIFRENGVTKIRYVDSSVGDITAEKNKIYYSLTGCDQQFNKIYMSDAQHYNSYFVVTRISHVEQIFPELSGDYYYEADGIRVSYDPPRTFIATGICLDMTNIPMTYIPEDNNYLAPLEESSTPEGRRTI